MYNNNVIKKPAKIYADGTKNEMYANCNSESLEGSNIEETTLSTIPQSVYDSLPTLLKRGTAAFNIERERDFFLTGALGVLSGCFTNISGTYDGSEIFPNLFVMNIAPPASGKGRMKFAETMVMLLQKELRKLYEDELKKNKVSKKVNKGAVINAPVLKTIFIAGNGSSAAIIKQLYENSGTGIIFETEADTLGKAFNQDWGAFLNELVRCSFQQETIRYQRATDKVYIEIEKPKLAIVLSGTPNQVKPIISSISNGLFSRFLYYQFKGDVELRQIGKDVNGINLTSHFESLGVDLCKFINGIQNNKYEFEFTPEQFKRSYEFFDFYFQSAKTFLGEDITSVIFRLGLILFKICMVLSVLREYDNKIEKNGLIVCRDEDFIIGLELIEVYMQHSFEVFSSLQKPAVKQELSLKSQFLTALPEGKFATKDVNDLTAIIGRQDRTLKNWLDEFVANGLINKVSHGVYEKMKKSN